MAKEKKPTEEVAPNQGEEDKATLDLRKRVIQTALGQTGAHYVWGGNGGFPGQGNIERVPNSDTEDSRYWAAACTTGDKGRRICSGRSFHRDVKRLEHGDPKNAAHMARPEKYAWERFITFEQRNDWWCEYCYNKRHFDCSGFVNWCIHQVCPSMFAGRLKISRIRKLSTVISRNAVDRNNLCVADILTRGNDHHIAFVIGGQSMHTIEAEIEAYGVRQGSFSHWQYHLRLPREIWLGSGAA